jgi:protein-S-isoprenylcysteine O-methyltransferase Ste14
MTEVGTRTPTISTRFWRWLGRTPVQTFILYPLLVIAVELAFYGRLTVVPWGMPLMAGGFLQYLLVGRYRHPRAGGSAGMEVPPQRITTTGPYRYTRNPMYLGHLVFLTGLAITFWSWLGLIVLVARALWFQGRVLRDEARLERIFGAEYLAYRSRVKRWIPGVW